VRVLPNPYRPRGLGPLAGLESQDVSVDPAPVLALLERCPDAQPTPLVDQRQLAALAGVARLWIKDERARMGMGSFKALGAAYVIAREAASSPGRRLENVTYVAASAGNHGLSVAVGARLFGARSVIFVSRTVPAALAARLREAGAEVVREGADYEESMAAAMKAAHANGWRLLSDSSWPGYSEIPRRVMEGYLVVGHEAAEEIDRPPTHVFLQAGVGGLAASLAAYFRSRWGDQPAIVVVEPEHARPLMESIRAGAPVRADGPPSTMGRLDCKEPSHLALAALARLADHFATVTDAEAEACADLLEGHDLATTPSGGAGVAALINADRPTLGLEETSRVLTVLSEGPLPGGSVKSERIGPGPSAEES
jgi:diaminopropionate ammonia-lyase